MNLINGPIIKDADNMLKAIVALTALYLFKDIRIQKFFTLQGFFQSISSNRLTVIYKIKSKINNL